MSPLTIYVETPVWNDLCLQDVDAHGLMQRLANRDASLVISTQLISELAATFMSKRLADPIRHGMKLFSYIREFIAARIPCLKMNTQLLQDEARAVSGSANGFNALLSTTDYDNMVKEVEKLSTGVFEPTVQSFLGSRRSLAQKTRREVSDWVKSRPELRTQCIGRSFEEFMKLSHPVDRIRVLRDHLREEFPATAEADLSEITVRLLQNPFHRVAHTMVRADMYLTWRAARAGTLARDVQDDCYHLVNASYCDVYATKDGPQSDYAPSVIGPTAVRCHGGSATVSDWLLAIAAE